MSRFKDPQQLFYRETFEEDPRAFWEDVKPIVPKLKQGQLLKLDGSESRRAIEAIPQYSKVHSFFDILQSKGKLNTIFTQNIDALELAANIDPDKIVACHGSWDTATCLSCDGKIQANDYLPVVLEKELPLCECGRPVPVDPNARHSSRVKKAPRVDEEHVRYLQTKGGHVSTGRVGRKKRRAIESELGELLRRDSDDDDKFDPPARQGLLKPDITFFGESVVKEYFPRLNEAKHEIDLLVIIGTSLAAEPVSKLPLEIPPQVPQIWISNQTTSSAGVRGLRVDIELVGDADLIITELCARANWGNALINRSWRNHLGSTRQAKAVAVQAQNLRVMSNVEPLISLAGSTDPPAVQETDHSPNNMDNGIQITDEKEKVEKDQPKVEPAALMNAVQFSQPAIQAEIANKDDPMKTSLAAASITEQKPLKAVEEPSIVDQSVIRTDTVASLPEETSSKGDLLPTKSPPLPYRSGSKRPLSIGDALTVPIPALEVDQIKRDAGLGILSPEVSPARPTKVARTQSTTSVAGKGGVVSAPELKIFEDAVFSNITYFKKK